jgi:hypothetical protein
MSSERALGPGVAVNSGWSGDAALRVALACAVAFALLLLVPPWRVQMPQPGLESSWQQVISHAAASHWQWGRDIAFTYGPLGYLRYPVFEPTLLRPLLLWNALLAAAAIACVLALLRRAPTAPAALLAAIVVAASSLLSGKGVFTLLPLFAAVLYFGGARRERVVAAFAIAATGVLANAYVASLMFGAAISALLDARRAAERRVPLFVALYVATAVAAFVASGQSPAALPDFLRSALEFVAGYADAMSLDGNAFEAVAFVALSFVALAVVIHAERSSPPLDRTLLALALALFWYVAWKGGFVRHDLHSVGAWASLAVGSALYAAARWTSLRSRAARTAAIATAVVACAAAAVVAGPGTLRTTLYGMPRAALVGGAAALSDPHGWLDRLASGRRDAYAAIRRAHPELAAQGSADVIGYEQAALLAQEIDYRPLPVFQPYAAYTPWLVALNASALRDERAADALFVGAQTIDMRYPLHDVSRAIVELLSRYDAEGVVGDYVRLRRRPAPREARMREIAIVETRLGEWVAVPDDPGALTLQARVEPSLLGRFARFALRAPHVWLRVRLADGTEATHRIVPVVAGVGFLLSPYPASVGVRHALFAQRAADAAAARVTAIQVDTRSISARRFFDERISLRVARIDFTPRGSTTAGVPDR